MASQQYVWPSCMNTQPEVWMASQQYVWPSCMNTQPEVWMASQQYLWPSCINTQPEVWMASLDSQYQQNHNSTKNSGQWDTFQRWGFLTENRHGERGLFMSTWTSDTVGISDDEGNWKEGGWTKSSYCSDVTTQPRGTECPRENRLPVTGPEEEKAFSLSSFPRLSSSKRPSPYGFAPSFH
ncbi:hypothetical protein RRG08_002415 [Elysia crispata]|uniref:Uncharacterized protein n=1 Tax=Elysia crispata TaxID=231223 RepID=A0AAE1DFB0_9GAST|nr:hypothetical protein RRG08_002415 [Elysia crispata]